MNKETRKTFCISNHANLEVDEIRNFTYCKDCGTVFKSEAIVSDVAFEQHKILGKKVDTSKEETSLMIGGILKKVNDHFHLNMQD